MRSTSKLLKDIIPDGQIIVDVAKGIEDKTFDTMTEIMEEELIDIEKIAEEALEDECKEYVADDMGFEGTEGVGE